MIKIITDFIRRITLHDILGTAAKTTYYLLLSFFPLSLLIIAAVSKTDTELFRFVMPPFVLKILDDIITISPSLKATAASFILAVWSASTAIRVIMDGIYMAYTGHSRERLKYGRVRAIIFTLLLTVFVFICVSFTFISSMAVDFMAQNFSWANAFFFRCGHFIAIFAVIFLFVFSLYAMVLGRKIKTYKIYTGIFISSIFWVISTWVFEFYMSTFNNYSVLYGSIGTFLGLALWLFIVTTALFFGAEVNVILYEKS